MNLFSSWRFSCPLWQKNSMTSNHTLVCKPAAMFMSNALLLYSLCISSSEMVGLCCTLALPSRFSCTVWALKMVLDCWSLGYSWCPFLGDSSWWMAIAQREWMLGSSSYTFLHFASFPWPKTTSECRSIQLVLRFRTCNIFSLAFKYCSNTPTADFVALFAFLLPLLATSISTSSVTLAN